MKFLKVFALVAILAIGFASCEKQETVVLQDEDDVIQFIETNFQKTKTDITSGRLVGNMYSDGETNIFIVDKTLNFKTDDQDDVIKGHLKWRIIGHHIEIYCVPPADGRCEDTGETIVIYK